MDSKIKLLESLHGGLVVSCQATQNSPLAKPEIIAAFAKTAELNGAVGVRIDSPEHISTVKKHVKIPVLGIYKIVSAESEVYITPTFRSAREIAEAGAAIIALDATLRVRPNSETLEFIVGKIQAELDKPVMADVATFEEGLYAVEQLGVDLISTTLSGYTKETKHLTAPDFKLLEKLAKRLKIPVVSEGRLRSADDVKRAFDCGAFAVVVGNAITGIDSLVEQFANATPRRTASVSK